MGEEDLVRRPPPTDVKITLLDPDGNPVVDCRDFKSTLTPEQVAEFSREGSTVHLQRVGAVRAPRPASRACPRCGRTP